MIPPIYVAFTLVAALLLWFVIGARGKWWLKLPMIVIVPLFMFVVWSSLGSFSGWPTSNKPPKVAYYTYGYVIEPDANVHVKGAVYVWLVPGTTKHGVLDYAPKYGEPRAYKLPYSKGLESQIQAANQAVAKGEPIAFTSQSKGTLGKGKKGKGKGTVTRRGGYHFYDLRPHIQTKGQGQ